MQVFKKGLTTNKKRKMFFDEPVDIARYDDVKYSEFDKLSQRQLGFFWRPEEISLKKDKSDFRNLPAAQAHIFTSNLSRQIMLDSMQGRAPSLALLPIVSLPEVENWIQLWSANETVHSRAYTHIIRNVYSNPSVVFDKILDIEEIVLCARDISKYYDDLIKLHNSKDKMKQKVALWKCINAINALEGIRFYVSFACSWAFAELKIMEGNAKEIKLIARDENLHLAGTTHMLKLLVEDDSDFKHISKDCEGEVLQMMEDVVTQEKQWAEYLFKDGTMIGLNNNVLQSYVEWIAAKRCSAIGINHNFTGGSNPLPWTQTWIGGNQPGGRKLKPAPQETELVSYVVGGINNDIDDGTFKDFEL